MRNDYDPGHRLGRCHHDVAVVDDQGRVLAPLRLDADLTRLPALVKLMAEHGRGVRGIRSRRQEHACGGVGRRRIHNLSNPPASGRPLSKRMASPEPSPTTLMPSRWPTCCAPTEHVHRPCRKPSPPWRSMRWLANTEGGLGAAPDDRPAAFGAPGVLHLQAPDGDDFDSSGLPAAVLRMR
jgi:hypothetical protein